MDHCCASYVVCAVNIALHVAIVQRHQVESEEEFDRGEVGNEGGDF